MNILAKSFLSAGLLSICLVSGLPIARVANAFPKSDEARDQLPEARLHEKIRDRYVDLPDSYQAVAGERKIALYIGIGSWKAGKQHMKRLFRRYNRSYQVVTAKDILVGILDPAVFSVLAMPGGKSWKYLEELGAEGADKIRRFVDAGGGYMGFCAGAYYAVSHRNGPDPLEPYGIGLLEGEAYDGASYKVWEYKDGMHRFPVKIPTFYPRYSMLMLGGPSFRYTDEEALKKKVRVLGRFPKSLEPAMITFNYGRGRVFISGPHGEIEERKYLWGLVFHDQDSEWPFLDAMLSYLSGGEFPAEDPSQG